MKRSPAIAIRHAKPKDYEALFRLFTTPEIAHWVIDFPPTLINHSSPWLTSAIEEQYILIALASGEIVGSVELRIRTSLRQRHVARIGAIGVAPEWQGQGIGTQLMNAATELAEQVLTIHRLDSLIFTDNNQAVRLFEKFGFVLEGTLQHLILRANQYADVYSMVRLSSS